MLLCLLLVVMRSSLLYSCCSHIRVLLIDIFVLLVLVLQAPIGFVSDSWSGI
jgi:hypothetical protein